MLAAIRNWFWSKLVKWLLVEQVPDSLPLINFARLCANIQPADVLLVEGRTRVSGQIALITQSVWTHAALYIGRAGDLPADLRSTIAEYYDASDSDQLLVEAELGAGTTVRPVSNYDGYHLRICRPQHLAGKDALSVIRHAVGRLGVPYNIRQLLDLGRFLYPYAILPRRWRSSLFEHKAGDQTKLVCSSMIAQAFTEVKFPIVPTLRADKNGKLTMLPRNHKLVTPRDFDYSPYFSVIKYPLFSIDDLKTYRDLPWDESGHGRALPTGEFDAIPSPGALMKPRAGK